MIDENAVRRIEDLHKLKEAGVITEEEFAKAKQELLFKPRPVKAPVFNFTSTDISLPMQEDVVGWLRLPFQKYADFEGRSCRREYWMFAFLQAAAAFIGLVLISIATEGESPIMMGLTALMLCLFAIACLIPAIAVTVRRFHDQDKSGWFALLGLIPYIGWIIILIFMLIEGTKGDNRFGPAPLQERG